MSGCAVGTGACSHLLCARSLTRRYSAGERRPSRAGISGVSLALDRRDRVAIVGRSGAGKSTLARCLALWERPDAGEIRVDGVNPWAHTELPAFRRRVQLVLQDAETAFNPQFTAVDAVEEALRYGGPATAGARLARARALLDLMKLPGALADRNARSLSGGERRRVLLARALATAPAVIILDETLASFDADLTARIVGQLAELQADAGFSLVLITHDLRAARDCERMVVIDDGVIAESGPVAEIMRRPQSSAGCAFVAAADRLAVPAC